MTHYEIRVKENALHNWNDWFREFQIQLADEADQSASVLRLSGDLPDQAALLGVLMRLHNLNLTILSVQIKEIEEGRK